MSVAEVQINNFSNDQKCSQINLELQPGECQYSVKQSTAVDLFNDTCRSALSSGLMLKRDENWRKFYAPTKRCNPPEERKISTNSPNRKGPKNSSDAHGNRLSAGHRNEMNDINSQSSVILNTTSSQMYPVVHLIKDQCSICKGLFVSNLVRHAHVCTIAANKHLVRSDTAIGSTDRIAGKMSRKMIVTESSVRLYTCRVCREGFHRKDELTKHLTRHTQDNTHLSSQSSDLSKERDGLIGHVPTGELSQTEAKKFACTICSYQSNNKCRIFLHMRIHTGEKPFSCTICSYRCNQSGNLSKHMRIHTGEKQFACTICSYQCSASHHLSNHMRRHTGEKSFACTICSYRCYHSNSLSNHMFRHTGEKPFACTQCSYQCCVSSSLSTHKLRRHTSEKQFACNVCTYRCATNGELLRHLLHRHTDEKPFACTTCSYRCKQSNNLSSHMRRHTGEKSFACTQCSYKCRHSSSLSTHILRRHFDRK